MCSKQGNDLKQTNQQIDGSINIIGDGSIGHLLAGYLLRSGQPVSLYSHSDKPSRTVTLVAPESAFNFKFTTQTQALTQIRTKSLTIIAAKAHQFEGISRQLSQLAYKPSCILLMMNGLGLLEIAEQWLPSVAVYQASTTQAAKLTVDSKTNLATLEHTGYGETLIGDFGPQTRLSASSNQPDRNPINTLTKMLGLALPPVSWSNNHHQNLWFKLFINAIINPLTAINDVANGALIDDPVTNATAQQLTQDLSPLLQQVLPGITWQTLFSKILDVASATAKNSSSMRQDIKLGRKTEIDFITGYILKKAQKFGCSLSSHQQLYQQVKGLENQTQTSVTK